MCLYPTLRINKKYVANKKNKGVIPPLNDNRVLYVPTGCGKCMECMKKKARDWQVRMLEDLKHNKNGIFVTLTLSNESIKELDAAIHNNLDGYDRDNEIAILAVDRFNERWRKKYKKFPRHWLITELGHKGTENIHLHGIIWTNENKQEIEQKWKYGFVYFGTYVNEQTINYIVKYITKQDDKHKEYTPRVLASKGIGSNYLMRYDSKTNMFNNDKTIETYTNRQGYKMNLPIYYRNKIYTDEEKEQLWLQKLDKNTRYVNGRKIDVSQNEDDYYRVLEEERQRNKRLGYGNNEKNWDRKIYENNRRNMLRRERLKDKNLNLIDEEEEKLNNIINRYITDEWDKGMIWDIENECPF